VQKKDEGVKRNSNRKKARAARWRRKSAPCALRMSRGVAGREDSDADGAGDWVDSDCERVRSGKMNRKQFEKERRM
jgi:hypothetical protein